MKPSGNAVERTSSAAARSCPGPVKPRCKLCWIRRPADVSGGFPNEATIIPLVGAQLLEQNGEWAIQR